MPYINAILNRTYLNTGTLLLSIFYKGLFTIVTQIQKCESIKFVFKPFWFLQL